MATEADQPPAARDLPYLEITDPSYAEQAARTFELIALAPAGHLLRGPCPRCTTVFEVPLFGRVFEGQRTVAPTTTSADNETETRQPSEEIEPIACLCNDSHSGRPGGITEGCGAYWNLAITAEEP